MVILGTSAVYTVHEVTILCISSFSITTDDFL